MDNSADQLVRVFRLAAEYRRCAWYAVFGAALIIGVAAFLRANALTADNGGWTSFVTGSSALLLAAIALLLAAYRWRLRLDDVGLSRRRWFRWDLWSWDEFPSGEIVRRDDGFESTERPWWCKRLSLSMLSDEDQAFVRGACKYFFRPIDEKQSELPSGELTIRYQLFCTIVVSENGVAGNAGRRSFSIPWPSVKEVRLVYFDHWSPELRKIEIDLPDRTLRVEAVNKIASSVGSQRYMDAKIIPRTAEHFLRAYL